MTKLFISLLLSVICPQTMAVPTITLAQLSDAINSPDTDRNIKTVLEGLLNDFMDLQYAKSTPYTTGKQILPSGSTIENVTEGLKDGKAPDYVRNVLGKISDTFNKGDLTPQRNDGSWDPKLTPVLQLVKGN